MMSDDTKIQSGPYIPNRDMWLFRGIAMFLAVFAVVCIGGAIGLAIYDHQDVALVTIGLGSGSLGALTSFFTQNIPR